MKCYGRIIMAYTIGSEQTGGCARQSSSVPTYWGVNSIASTLPLLPLEHTASHPDTENETAEDLTLVQFPGARLLYT